MNSYIVWALFATVSFTVTQASPCREDEWVCQDGSCIPQEWRCDGRAHCSDRSDESHAVCHGEYCHESRFRCAYGACVDSTAFCDSVADCADASDEIPRRCYNITLIHQDEFKCKNGQGISADLLCDGAKNCADGSDETLDACAGWYCAHNHFQCAYGACVYADAKCSADEHWDCADGSDEDHVLCNRTQTIPNTTPETDLSGMCIVPDHPEHGKYTVMDRDWNTIPANPGDVFQSFFLLADCDVAYRPLYPGAVYCTEGRSRRPPQEQKCLQFCDLDLHPSITYFCGNEECDGSQPSGIVVRPQCKEYYIYPGELKNMTCINNNWDYVPTCLPDMYKTVEGATITLHIGKDLKIHFKGSQYKMSMDYDMKTILRESVPESVESSTDKVPKARESGRLNPAFHPRYDPIAYKERQEKKATQEN